MRLAAGLRTDQLGELTALPQTPSWILGVGAGKGEWKGGGERRGEERNGGERGKEGRVGRDQPPPNKKLVTDLTRHQSRWNLYVTIENAVEQ